MWLLEHFELPMWLALYFIGGHFYLGTYGHTLVNIHRSYIFIIRTLYNMQCIPQYLKKKKKSKEKSEPGRIAADSTAGGRRGRRGRGQRQAAACYLATGAAGDVTDRRGPSISLREVRAGRAAYLLLPRAWMRSPWRAAGCPRAPNKSTPRRAPASHDLMAPRDGACR